MRNRPMRVACCPGGGSLLFAPMAIRSFQATQLQPANTQTAAGGRGQPTAEQMATQKESAEDRQNMMDQRHIASFRLPVRARVFASANYDEGKANQYKLCA